MLKRVRDPILMKTKTAQLDKKTGRNWTCCFSILSLSTFQNCFNLFNLFHRQICRFIRANFTINTERDQLSLIAFEDSVSILRSSNDMTAFQSCLASHVKIGFKFIGEIHSKSCKYSNHDTFFLSWLPRWAIVKSVFGFFHQGFVNNSHGVSWWQ